jgi:hypothetical protein
MIFFFLQGNINIYFKFNLIVLDWGGKKNHVIFDHAYVEI